PAEYSTNAAALHCACGLCPYYRRNLGIRLRAAGTRADLTTIMLGNPASAGASRARADLSAPHVMSGLPRTLSARRRWHAHASSRAMPEVEGISAGTQLPDPARFACMTMGRS